ncbi:hypothetical protein D3C73_965720 [compost metagenome]
MKFREFKKLAKKLLIYLSMITVMASNIEGVAAENIQPIAQVTSDSLKSVTENVYNTVGNQQEYSVERYLIRFKNLEQTETFFAARQLNLETVEEQRSKALLHTNIVVADLNESELNQLLDNDSVLSIEPDAPVRIVGDWTTS